MSCRGLTTGHPVFILFFLDTVDKPRYDRGKHWIPILARNDIKGNRNDIENENNLKKLF
ncbi:hypothetical protein RMB_05270 [Rickettsia massiliae str. AZT80]|uniref:Uncharacterized protein n=1 Tax=Rickettsia massiliae str. AZT80 TaxID=1105112 RepID=H6QJG5_RICMA|nr:hypothetical protein RMB_05270 [Rickettsia massiliae str. AZT80]